MRIKEPLKLREEGLKDVCLGIEYTQKEQDEFIPTLVKITSVDVPKSLDMLRFLVNGLPEAGLEPMSEFSILAVIDCLNQLTNRLIASLNKLTEQFPNIARDYARRCPVWPFLTTGTYQSYKEIQSKCMSLKLGDNYGWFLNYDASLRHPTLTKQLTVQLARLVANTVALYSYLNDLRSARSQVLPSKPESYGEVEFLSAGARRTLRGAEEEIESISKILKVPSPFKTLRSLLIFGGHGEILKRLALKENRAPFDKHNLQIWAKLTQFCLTCFVGKKPEKNAVLAAHFRNSSKHPAQEGLSGKELAKDKKYRLRSRIFAEMRRTLRNVAKHKRTTLGASAKNTTQ